MHLNTQIRHLHLQKHIQKHTFMHMAYTIVASDFKKKVLFSYYVFYLCFFPVIGHFCLITL